MGTGVSHPPIEEDERLLKAVDTLELTSADVELFWRAFRKQDAGDTSSMSKVDFFVAVCQQRQFDTDFGNSLYELCGIEDDGSLDFGQFMAIVTTFGAFETAEMLKYCFFVFDKDKNGSMEEDELQLFVASIYGNLVPSNIAAAIATLDYDADGKLHYGHFEAMHAHYPAILYPCFQLQAHMRASVCGEGWWKRRLARLNMSQDDADDAKLAEEVRLKREAVRDRRRATIDRIGLLHYLFSPTKRAQQARIFAMQDEADAAPAAQGDEA